MFDQTYWTGQLGGDGWGVIVTGGNNGGLIGAGYPYGYGYPQNQTMISGQTNQILLLGLVVVAAVLILK